jgi:hypothetical protein
MKQVATPKPKIHLPDGSTKVVGEKQQEPLLKITLPAPKEGNPDEPLSIGRHNFAAQANFEQVGNLLMKTISNQKLIGLTIVKRDKEMKIIQKNIKVLSKNIRKLLKENK